MLTGAAEPIVAIATASGRGAIGVVRVSGPRLGQLIEALCGRALAPRHATFLPFLAGDGTVLDQGIALHFPAPHSFTGEDVLELQAHGGPVLLQLLLARCLEAAAEADPITGQPRLPGLRLAQPGEFSQRAFLNGKIDLAQAEAIADLIDASTEAAARSAGRSLSGAFSADVQVLRDALITLRMLVEATLDFPEEDIDFLQRADAAGQLRALQTQLAAVRRRAREGALLREGLRVVIAGQPNAGKSSLLNALAGAELAIVSAVAGTTRDVVAQTIQVHGVPLHVVDTAGLRDSDDEVERIGISRAWTQLESADAVLFLHDLTRIEQPGYADADQAIAAALQQRLGRAVPVIDVWSKADAAAPAVAREGVVISAHSGLGIDALRQKLLAAAGWLNAPEGVYLARARHVQALQEAASRLEQAEHHLEAAQPALDLLAEDLRLAQNAVNQITGEFGADDLLGVIFSRFCIGK